MHGSRYSLGRDCPGVGIFNALECDQEILILWNGYRCIRFPQPIIQLRTAACGLVRSKVAMEAGVTWPRDEWQGTIEPRVWNWLCRKHTEAALGSTHELKPGINITSSISQS